MTAQGRGAGTPAPFPLFQRNPVKRYDSPAWISAAMDDAGLTAAEFRVLAHVCRRAGDGTNGRGCDAGIAKMAETCRMKAATVRAALQALVCAGWLSAVERPGRVTIYTPKLLPLAASDPSPETVGVRNVEEGNPSPETVAHPSLSGIGDPSPLGGAEGIPEGNPLSKTTHTRPDLDQVRFFAASSDKGITLECAEKFWRQNEAVGWKLRGQPVINWKPLLEAYAAAWNRFEAQRPQTQAKLPRMSVEEAEALLGGRSPSRMQKAAMEYPEPPIKLPRL